MSEPTRAPSAWQLEQAMSCFQSLERNFNPETDGEALDIAQGDVHVLLSRVIRAAVEADSFAAAVALRIGDMQERRQRYESRRDALRATAFAVMDALELKKITDPEFTVTIRAGSQRPMITDESAIPDEYKKTVISVDKVAINQAVKDGVVIPGVELSNALPSLNIRTK
jgi:hypothetical protein